MMILLYVSWLTMCDLQLAELIEVCPHCEFPEPCSPGRGPCIWMCEDTTLSWDEDGPRPNPQPKERRCRHVAFRYHQTALIGD